MNNWACEKVFKCRDDIESLANDDWIPHRDANEDEQILEQMQAVFPLQNLEETKDRLRQELRGGRYNAFCQKIGSDDNALFFSQILTEDEI